MLHLNLAVKRFHLIASIVAVTLIACPTEADTTKAKAKTKGTTKALALYYPAPIAVLSTPGLLVVPLLGPAQALLPGGKLLIWVGRDDGTPLPSTAISISVPGPAPSGNSLAFDGQRQRQVTLTTDPDGLVEVFLAAPDVPRSTDSSSSEGTSDDLPENNPPGNPPDLPPAA